MSAFTSSSASWARPCSKSARTNLVAHGTSAASSAKACSASGSRSMAISVPAGPRRSATSRAWPAAPSVQSMAIWPGCGSSASISSPASTGTCVRGMSSRMAKCFGQVTGPRGQVGVVCLPGGAGPELEAVAGAGDDDLAVDPRVGQVSGRQHHAAGRVELRVRRPGVEHPLELAGAAGKRVHALQRRLRDRLVRRARIQRDAGVRPLHEEDPTGERRAELRGDREPVLRVERVFEGAVEGQGAYAKRGAKVQSIRGGGVGGAPPPRTGFAKGTYPTMSHSATQLSSDLPQNLSADVFVV